MSLILAIEPDPRQSAQLADLVRRRLRAELVHAATTEGALAALAKVGDRVPDLVLVPSLLSAQEDAAIAGALRIIARAANVRMLTIPLLASREEAAKSAGMLAKLRGKKAKSSQPGGCDPDVFADQIQTYLDESAAERKAKREELADHQSAVEQAVGAVVARPRQTVTRQRIPAAIAKSILGPPQHADGQEASFAGPTEPLIRPAPPEPPASASPESTSAAGAPWGESAAETVRDVSPIFKPRSRRPVEATPPIETHQPTPAYLSVVLPSSGGEDRHHDPFVERTDAPFRAIEPIERIESVDPFVATADPWSIDVPVREPDLSMASSDPATPADAAVSLLQNDPVALLRNASIDPLGAIEDPAPIAIDAWPEPVLSAAEQIMAAPEASVAAPDAADVLHSSAQESGPEPIAAKEDDAATAIVLEATPAASTTEDIGESTPSEPKRSWRSRIRIPKILSRTQEAPPSILLRDQAPSATPGDEASSAFAAEAAPVDSADAQGNTAWVERSMPAAPVEAAAAADEVIVETQAPPEFGKTEHAETQVEELAREPNVDPQARLGKSRVRVSRLSAARNPAKPKVKSKGRAEPEEVDVDALIAPLLSDMAARRKTADAATGAAAREAAAREVAAREAAAREAAVREAAAREAEAREATAREAEAREAAAREKAAREAAEREAAAREAAEREASARAAEAREAAAREKAAREAAEREAAAREAAEREASAREAEAREAAARERTAREAAERAAAEREAEVREMAARERAAREALEREATAREVAAREAALKEGAAREAAARDAALKEAAAREAAEREAAAREAEAREATAREKAARDAAARERAAREAAEREAAAREAEAREAAAREKAAREAVAREKAAREAAERAAAAREAEAREAAAREKAAREAAAQEKAAREAAARDAAAREAAARDAGREAAALEALKVKAARNARSAPVAPVAPGAPGAPSAPSSIPDDVDPMFFADDALITPPPTAAQAERSAWIELVESLRQDIERLKGGRGDDTPAEAAPALDIPVPPSVETRHRGAAASAAAKPGQRSRVKPKRPTEDQWGLFDPEQCGFAALLAKLDEINDRDNTVS